MTINAIAPIAAAAAAAGENGSNDGNTTTPIKHVIVIIGENRTFDHLFATYVPKHKGEKVLNLLSLGIVNADGTPGSNYSAATQYRAIDTAPDPYLISPPKAGAYNAANPFPAPLASGGPPPFSTVAEAHTYEYGLPPGYYKYLTTGAVPAYLDGQPDMRIYYDGKDVNHQVGPYQLTNTVNPTGPTMSYDDYAESPVHRFYQMWQQLDCTASLGCQNDLFPWVEATVGAGSNGLPPPANFTYKEGATAMGFYNVQQGDVPYFKQLADSYSMSDNFHQSVEGGTGANHIMLGTGDAIWFSDGNGNPLTPPHNMMVAAGSPNAGVVDEVENPNPLTGTNNWYIEDGYADLMSCNSKSCNLPAVSFVKPDGYLDGHPASSKVNLFEGFVKKIVDMTKANSTLWDNTAIFVTFDEGGGYYDSGYVQPLDYFGDGTRIPMIAVSKYSKGGHISHTYTDHVSVLKFIEANWGVPPITNRSRDNLPNPTIGADPYKPTNGPAIGDLTDLFNFQ
jgi:phospholipase C